MKSPHLGGAPMASVQPFFSMSKLSILRYPDPRLHKVARSVAVVDARIQALVDDMLETMYEARGIGLAATQVDVHERVVVIDVSDERDQPLVLINPELTVLSAELVVGDEGCLSVPQIYDKVQRHERVGVRALGRDGQPHSFEADGLLAVCVQHEMDHLVGKVFVEYLSPLKRNRIRGKMLKRSRDDEHEQA
jgi:peptide deformylase